jgi:diguanylate cyclase (GGDEF)-like protein
MIPTLAESQPASTRCRADASIVPEGVPFSSRPDLTGPGPASASEILPPEFERQIKRLRFDDPEVEAEFWALNNGQGLDGFRVSVSIGLLGLIAWCLMDLMVVPEAVGVTWPLRFGVGFSTLAATLFASYMPWFQRHLFEARVAISLMSGLIMVACSVVTGLAGHQHYIGGLMLNATVCCVFPGQRFRVSVISIWFMFAAYQLVMYLDPRTTFVVLLCNTIFLAAINLTSLAASYSIELFSRTSFLQRRIILEQSEALYRAMRTAERAAIIDPLTGLYNRRHFFSEASRDLVRVSVIILDVDHFKSINDQFGHSVGDQVLREISERLRASIRPDDIACRYGGEEFAILLPNADLLTSATVGERLRSRIESEPFEAGTHSLRVTASVGVASVDEKSSGIESLVDRADRALYEAKNGGRNRVKLWNVSSTAIDLN